MGLRPQTAKKEIRDQNLSTKKMINLMPKKAKSAKRSQILKTSPQHIFLADVISDEEKKTRKEDKKNAKKSGKRGTSLMSKLGKFVKFAGAAAGIYGAIRVVGDVIKGSKDYKGSTSNIVASGIAGEQYKSAGRRAGSQASKYGGIGAGIGTFFGPLGTLAGGVAHDLNNILGGLVSYPELLLLQLPEESPLREPILTIQKSGDAVLVHLGVVPSATSVLEG